VEEKYKTSLFFPQDMTIGKMAEDNFREFTAEAV
jgi:hypothetical protein